MIKNVCFLNKKLSYITTLYGQKSLPNHTILGGKYVMSSNEARHQFDEATELTFHDGVFTGKTSAAYANMVGPFGGVIGAQLLNAVLQHPKLEGEPIAITINYAAPIKDGEFTIRATPARTNRSTQHWVIDLSQDDNILATATAVTASRRETWSAPDLEPPSVPSPDQVPSLPNAGLPDWVSNYDIRLIRGFPDVLADSPPENEDSETVQWIEDKPKRPLDALSLASMSDAFFPRVFVRRNKILPASTVSLTIYFHADESTFANHGAQPVLGHARALRFYNGYFDQTAEMWSQDGKLLASSTQVVYYRD